VLLLLTPFIGVGKGVARRWIVIAGMRFQPSEIMKLAIVLFLAWCFTRYQKYITDYSDFRRSSTYGVFMPVGVIAAVCALIALQNHFSCMIIMFLIGMVVIFAGGARKIWFAIAGAGAAVFSALAITMSGYARERVDVWLNPGNYSSQDEVWQTIQGLIAVGSGGFFGVGLGNSRQKHLFVSEPQNDFIFSIICEELCFVGAVMVILLFIIFIWRGFIIALRAPDTFSSLVVVGIVGKVAIQALLNMAVVTSMIPNTGISLPFFSYGGTALAMLLGEMGIILSISRYSYEMK
jgi:cell division protein FtsW